MLDEQVLPGKQKSKKSCAAEGEDPTEVTFVMDAYIREKQQAMSALHLAEKHIRLRLIWLEWCDRSLVYNVDSAVDTTVMVTIVITNLFGRENFHV